MNYKTVEIKSPRATEQPGKYYASLVTSGSIGFEEFATRITATCTVTRHDALAVLSALQEQIIYALQEGKNVHLGDVGNFRVVLKSTGTDLEKDFKATNIKGLRVCFMPNTTLKNALMPQNKAISFRRVKDSEDVVEDAGQEEVQD